MLISINSLLIFTVLFFSFRTTEETFETTTSSFPFDLNTTDAPITVSLPVTSILREIFRTYELYCSRRKYNRGIGRPLQVCPDHALEQDGLLCYPSCRYDYNGVGPICWKKCQNLTSFGFVCLGISLPEKRSCSWYDKCGIIKPSCISCPMNYTKLGCLCGRLHLRDSYSRGIGFSLICSNSYEQSGGLCYKKCDKGYHGIGPLCLQTCPSNQSYSCFTGCSKTKEICKHKIKDIIKSIVVSALSILNFIIGIPLVSLKIVDILNYAAKAEWISVMKDITVLAGELTEKILPVLIKKYSNWPFNTVESATKNASLILTAAAMKNQTILYPIFKYFNFDLIDIAFDHGKCEI